MPWENNVLVNIYGNKMLLKMFEVEKKLTNFYILVAQRSAKYIYFYQ